MDLNRFIQNENKIAKIQERHLLSVLNDYLCNYSKLLQSSGSVSIETQHADILKTLNDLNPNIIKEIFYRSTNLTYGKDNLFTHFFDNKLRSQAA